jgi:ADP-heptose:LPS heptosyltransferase
MTAAMFNPLLDAAEIDLVSLQVGPAAAQIGDMRSERVIFEIAGKIVDFSDTAAVISQLDLVIGVDTAVLHLAGALGKPAWLLASAAPDYRWLADGTTTVWYPTVRIFRQKSRGDWAGVVADTCRALTGR